MTYGLVAQIRAPAPSCVSPMARPMAPVGATPTDWVPPAFWPRPRYLTMHRHPLPSQGSSRHRLQPGKNARPGATSVEFAVVAPILFLLMLAIFEFGRAFMVTGLLTDAARRGCRKGIV